jgi:hypothetical protein
LSATGKRGNATQETKLQGSDAEKLREVERNGEAGNAGKEAKL